MNENVQPLKKGSPNRTEGREKNMGLEIMRDVTGKSESTSDVRNFAELFKDRYERLKKIIDTGSNSKQVPLGQVSDYRGDDVFLVGLVQDRRRTKKGDQIVRMEDLSGDPENPAREAIVWISQKKEGLSERVENILPDEVVGFEARVPPNLDGSRSPLVWGNKMQRPESQKLEGANSPPKISRSEGPLAVLTSDFHVGSTEFLEKPFQRFLNWLSGKRGPPKEKELAERVEYLLVAGDAVDGGGVYPSQEKELEIRNVKKQYERLAEYLSNVPDHINVVVGPGNHDPVRLAEPQPAIPEDLGSLLVDRGVTLVGNPCLFKIGNVRFLLYHGEGFDDLVSAGIGLGYDDREELMVETMRRGHLAPVYRNSDGDQAPTAPERRDYLVIDEPVDVFHAGHSHKFGFCERNGTSMVLSGTFQSQTSFQKRKGISPDPGKVALVGLETGSVVGKLGFLGGGLS
ncbi:hypothetical protein AKJ38_00515 [candidate division MSBL1 archaeon SCGC-AAA259I14]|uniref:DNA polymerase II small subunit n=1 Tax=candidate division MSBL1 archaeon SCGC-AAA259I14 TaxID=1698268 RepID=A0A133UTZ6_9EURY|nr:hypothetical protein AKJ38_00515 [candidate division MSBL1 archaeon SCGC-AAA259I14]